MDLNRIRLYIRSITHIGDEVDTAAAAERIKSGIWFRGTNCWILAFSIIIASVGLNVNSTAVIIGAMLISPLMGPIVGMGLGLVSNDNRTFNASIHNYLIMTGISLLTATLYFVISPLELVNPTELIARTSPTIYDVIIAFFGGMAGTFEHCRKEKGTVISGVAIATALMPPLCTAGYGLASLNFNYFAGALYLFLINTVFIILATYISGKILKFKEVDNVEPVVAKRRKRIYSLIIIAIIVPSIITAVSMVRANNFERDLNSFISDNKTIGGAYIYDYKVISARSKEAEIFLAGQTLTPLQLDNLYSSVEKYGLDKEKIKFSMHDLRGDDNTEQIIKGIYERNDEELARRDARIKQLEEQLRLATPEKIPYEQIARELRFRYPSLTSVSISKGAVVRTDSLVTSPSTYVVAKSTEALSPETVQDMENSLRIRMEDSLVTVIQIVEPIADGDSL